MRAPHDKEEPRPAARRGSPHKNITRMICVEQRKTDRLARGHPKPKEAKDRQVERMDSALAGREG